ncbi:MAG: right-handed parallel beta-helix repeat-containing protein, partial [Paludibacteraceae bacterium]|nr:right-handed parallel beta-helix repeat-containing protein [Paludibacteraceae bacterium]
MKKIAFLLAMAVITALPTEAQLLQTIKKAAQKAEQKTQSTQQPSGQEQPKTQQTAQQTAKKASGKIYYVSANGKSRGADGLTPETAKKDIQAVLNIIKENGEDGAVVRVGEGNFLGYTNQGYIEIANFITLEGGWNETFTERDPFKYITRIQPGEEQRGTNGSKGLITTTRNLDDVMSKVPKGDLIIDGIMLDMGLENFYKPAIPDDERFGCPSAAFETGRMEDATPPQIQHQIFHSDGWIAGNVIIRNCLIANSSYFGLQFGSRCGEVEICNCVIISNRYAGVRIDGGDKDGKASHVNFHHNTVAFSWCRDKYMEDMGYGYEFMNKINADVHHNIFIGNNYAAVARTRIDSKEFEAIKKTNLYDNYFFLNAADLQLPSKGGGKWTNIKCSDIEDMVDEQTIPRAENNKELPANDPFFNAIDKDYLEAFANLKIIAQSQNFDANSASNRFRQATGQNMQGSEVRRVSMFGNRYNFDKALRLFGAKPG